jgi:hypothetical protein
MKKVVVLLIVLCALNLSAQKSFEKKTNVIGFGMDLGFYNYTSKVATNTTSDQSGALNKMLSLQYERGILNWLGVGTKVQLSDYFTSTDSVTHTKPSVKAIDGSLFLNAHFVRTKHVDMLAGFNVGYSHMNYEARDQAISSATGGGIMYDLHLQPRFYFGNHVGMFINLAYVHYGYRNMDFQNTYSHANNILDLTGGGINFGFGIQGKF